MVFMAGFFYGNLRMTEKTMSITETHPDHLIRSARLAPSLGIGRTTLWRWVKEGVFPAPVKLSDRVTVWRVGDVREWLQSKSQA